MKTGFVIQLLLTLTGTYALASSELLFENSDFEKGTLENWTAEGDAMTMQPTKGDQLVARNKGTSNVQGQYWIGTAEKYDGKSGKPGGWRGQGPTGRLVSKEFTVTKPYITFRIAGGCDYEKLNVGLIVGGKELLGATGIVPRASDTLKPASLNVKKFIGKKAQVVISDNGDKWFRYISADDFRASDEPRGVAYRPIRRTKLRDEWSTFPLYGRVGYDQDYRPQFHFTSRIGWLNDPNGMVYYDGEWHMLFQHFAKGNACGAKSWGNAVSTDLVHWTQLPHAINPYPSVAPSSTSGIHAIWSGSAVVDFDNVLGKQKGNVKALFAMYTATNQNAHKKPEFFQAAMYSIDRGRTWTKINNGKAIIANQSDGIGGQRDPRLFYYAPGKFYVMIMMIGGKERAVRLWKSTDLMNWKAFLDIPHKAAECIDMYALAVDGDKKNIKWVISSAPTIYEVGNFDGAKWTGLGMRNKHNQVNKFDYGDCYYAAQTFNHSPDGRVVHVGWLNSGSSFVEKGMPFTQQMSVPAEITLRTTPDGIRMFRNPVIELKDLYIKTDTFEQISVKDANVKLAALNPELIDMTIKFAPAGNFDLNLRGQKITYEERAKAFKFTNLARKARIEAQQIANAKLPKDKQRLIRDNSTKRVPAPTENGTVKLRVLVDRASLELFVNDGQAAASFSVVPDKDNRKITVTGNDSMKFKSIVVNELKSAWSHIKD